MITYLSNFHRGISGNKLAYGKDLILQVKGASIITGRLMKRKPDGSFKVIQIEQSGRKSNTWPDKVKFEMVEFDGAGDYMRMPRGPYAIKVWFWLDGKGGSFSEKFEVE